MLNGSKVTLWQAVVVLRCEGYGFGICHRGNYYEVTLYRMFHLFHSRYKSPNDLAMSMPSSAVHSRPNPLTIRVGLAAEYVSHYHESDLPGPSRGGGDAPEDLVFRVPGGVTHQAAELPGPAAAIIRGSASQPAASSSPATEQRTLL